MLNCSKLFCPKWCILEKTYTMRKWLFELTTEAVCITRSLVQLVHTSKVHIINKVKCYLTKNSSIPHNHSLEIVNVYSVHKILNQHFWLKINWSINKYYINRLLTRWKWLKQTVCLTNIQTRSILLYCISCCLLIQYSQTIQLISQLII